LSKTHAKYEDYLVRRHRPAHIRRNADRWAAFLIPHLRPDMQVLDIGCGPGSITAGLPGEVIGVDVHPVPIPGSPVAAGDGGALPFAD
jgi:2-polyprenyl-3-methyl-5-hydroxy-6-metoxy-1,4-benzoquinol methylase